MTKQEQKQRRKKKKQTKEIKFSKLQQNEI